MQTLLPLLWQVLFNYGLTPQFGIAINNNQFTTAVPNSSSPVPSICFGLRTHLDPQANISPSTLTTRAARALWQMATELLPPTRPVREVLQPCRWQSCCETQESSISQLHVWESVRHGPHGPYHCHWATPLPLGNHLLLSQVQKRRFWCVLAVLLMRD